MSALQAPPMPLSLWSQGPEQGRSHHAELHATHPKEIHVQASPALDYEFRASSLLIRVAHKMTSVSGAGEGGEAEFRLALGTGTVTWITGTVRVQLGYLGRPHMMF